MDYIQTLYGLETLILISILALSYTFCFRWDELKEPITLKNKNDLILISLLIIWVIFIGYSILFNMNIVLYILSFL